MSSTSKTAAIALLLIIIGACGFGVGYKISSTDDLAALFPSQWAEKLTAQHQNKNLTYISVVPSIGPLSRTVYTGPLEIRQEKVTAALPNEKAKDVKVGQRVIFYDRNEAPHPVPGAIEAVTVEGENTVVTFNLVAFDTDEQENNAAEEDVTEAETTAQPDAQDKPDQPDEMAPANTAPEDTGPENEALSLESNFYGKRDDSCEDLAQEAAKKAPLKDIENYKARILLEDRDFVRRLPYETLVSTDKGDRYIWITLPNADGSFTLRRHAAPRLMDGDKYYEAEYTIGMETPVLLNPPEDLQDGQIVKNVETFILSAPNQSLIELAAEQGFLRLVGESRQKEEKIREEMGVADCGNVVDEQGYPLKKSRGTPAGGQSGACGSAPKPVFPPPDDGTAFFTKSSGSSCGGR